MKMVKSLLLGSAAGLVAVAGAQAADMPVKAKPVQYVKICSLYGAGFYYIPGTDTCIKIGGWVRAQYMFGIDNGTNGPLVASTTAPATGSASASGGGGTFSRISSDSFQWRARGYITADVREQSAYGTVRAYIALGRSGDENGGAATNFSSNRLFMQFAGFTFGLAASFYDFYSGPAVSYYGGQVVPASDTGDGGNWVGAYTAQLGNGFSASISAEDKTVNRDTVVINGLAGSGYAAPASMFGAPTQAIEGFQVPDIVGNLRVDQAWGGAQVMAAYHRVATEYNQNTATAPSVGSWGHPSNKDGFAVGAGLKLNAPMIGAGDYFQAQVNYTEGGLGYLYAGRGDALYAASKPGGSYGFGVVSDAVVTGTIAGGSNLDLTTGWGVNASYEHHWNPAWKTSVYGVYDAVKYDTAANTALCSIEGTYGMSAAVIAAGECNNNFQNWAVGSRTQWNVTKNFYMGVDIVYQKLETASANAGVVTTTGVASAQPTGPRTMSDQDAWIGYFRVHYDFYP